MSKESRVELSGMGMEASTGATPDRSALFRRSWQGIETWRLAFGLAFAPVPPLLCYGLLTALASGSLANFVVGPWSPPLPFEVMAIAAELWSVAFGTFYLLTSPRRSGTITRGSCLFVGGLTGVFFPTVVVLLFLAAVDEISLELMTMALAYNLLGGLFLMPLGVIGGWTFWLVAVRPAKLQPGAIERVFE
jgi:hypothetical protein